MSDFDSVVGMVTLQFDGSTPALVFTGPDVPARFVLRVSALRTPAD